MKVHEKNYPKHDLELSIVVFCFENMVLSSLWCSCGCVHQSRQSSICVWLERVWSQIENVVIVTQGFYMSILYHPWKDNVLLIR